MRKTPLVNRSRLRRISPQPFGSCQGGFSLIEVLTVLSIVLIMGYLVAPGFVALNQAGTLRSNTATMGDLLEQAYSTALSKNTYVWVGFSQLTADGGGVAMASAYSAHANPADFPSNITPLTRSVFLPHLNLTIITTQITNPDRASTSVAQITSGAASAWSSTPWNTQIEGAQQTLSYVMEITPSGQVSLSPTNRYAWMEIGLAPLNGNGKNVSVLQMNAFTGRVSTYQP